AASPPCLESFGLHSAPAADVATASTAGDTPTDGPADRLLEPALSHLPLAPRYRPHAGRPRVPQHARADTRRPPARPARRRRRRRLAPRLPHRRPALLQGAPRLGRAEPRRAPGSGRAAGARRARGRGP